MWNFFYMYVDIHTVETGYQCRDHQNDRQTCHTFHDGIHVVGDDGGEGVHGSRQNITVDVHGIVCLLQLDDHVFQ